MVRNELGTTRTPTIVIYSNIYIYNKEDRDTYLFYIRVH